MNTYLKNLEYYSNVEVYDVVPDYFSTKYIHINEEDEKNIRKIVEKSNLPLNSITYTEAYRYALNHGIIVLKTNNIK